MRIRSQKQLYFKVQSVESELSEELQATTQLLESLLEYDQILERVSEDLARKSEKQNTGRQGMTAEQVLLSSLLKSRKNYSYRQLSEATKDSICGRAFLKIELCQPGFHYKTLQSNIKLLSEETLDFINEVLKQHCLRNKIEDGNKTRTDATTIESNIHYPTDSAQMNDCIRVLSRILTRVYEDHGVDIKFQNHYRASKKKLFQINNSYSPKKKQKWNLELIRLCRKTIKYSKGAVSKLERFSVNSISDNNELLRLILELKHYLPLAEQVLDIAYRRIVKKEKVPADEKLFSIFEKHTDCIVKGKRDVVFGHKATITTGGSGLILDIEIHKGNPADSSLVNGVMERHKEFYNKAPKSMVFDGCYSSGENRRILLEEGVKNLTFSKESDDKATTSKSVRKALRFFRAGIEATVSMLKRIFGWTRVMDKGVSSFNKALKTGAVAYNLFILSRLSLQT